MSEMTLKDRVAMCVELGMSEDEARSQFAEISGWTDCVGDDADPIDF
ncbi:hypothetical protein ACOACQ_21855 [Nocardioides sp. CPCC 206347]